MSYLVAFPLWIMSNILFFVLLRYGAYLLTLTGLSMITSNIIWATMRNPLDLKIYFSSKDILVFSYGAAFWICLITGIVSVVLGILVFLLDKLFPTGTATFFVVDVLQDSENIIVEEEEDPGVTDTKPNINEGATDSSSATATSTATQGGDSEDDDNDADGFYLTPPPPVPKIFPVADAARPVVIRPRTGTKSVRTAEHRLTSRLQRPRRRDPPPRPPPQPDENNDGDYYNVRARRAEPRRAAQPVAFVNRLSEIPDAVFQNAADASVTMTNFEKV